MADVAEPSASLGSALKEKLVESIQNMDILTILQKMVATNPEDEESEEIREKLRGVMEKMSDMSDDEKEEFTQKIKEGLANKLAMKLGDPNVINLDGLEDAIKGAVMNQLILVGVFVLLVILLCVFFGYKLYKSIKDKEVKREEKKKAKQMKKKK